MSLAVSGAPGGPGSARGLLNKQTFGYLRQRVDNAKPTRYLHQAMTHLDFALFISRLADLACAFAI